MARRFSLKTHNTWEDWLGIALGTLIVISPLAAPQPLSEVVLLNAVTVGVLIVALSALEMVDLRRWEEAISFLLGGWLVAAPAFLGYAESGTLRFWHIVLGLAVMALAAFELWQDRKLSRDQLAKHGR